MVGMDKQLRLYACMLAPAPPLTGLILLVVWSRVWGYPMVAVTCPEWVPLPRMDLTYDLSHKYSCCDLVLRGERIESQKILFAFY